MDTPWKTAGRPSQHRNADADIKIDRLVSRQWLSPSLERPRVMWNGRFCVSLSGPVTGNRGERNTTKKKDGEMSESQSGKTSRGPGQQRNGTGRLSQSFSLSLSLSHTHTHRRDGQTAICPSFRHRDGDIVAMRFPRSGQPTWTPRTWDGRRGFQTFRRYDHDRLPCWLPFFSRCEQTKSQMDAHIFFCGNWMINYQCHFHSFLVTLVFTSDDRWALNMSIKLPSKSKKFRMDIFSFIPVNDRM